MTSAAHELPDDVDALRAFVLEQQREIETHRERIELQTAQIRQLEEYVRLLKPLNRPGFSGDSVS